MGAKRKILFTSHTANFHKFNRPLMKMLRGKLETPYTNLNIGGWQVDYASANEEEVVDADHIYTVDFARNPFRIDKHFRAYRQLKKILKQNHYDAIHTHTPVGSVITRLAAKNTRNKGTKVIYTCHGFQFYKGGKKTDWLLYYPVEKALSRITDLLITINAEDYRLAKKKFHCKTKKIDGVGVDLTKFSQKHTTEAASAARKKLGIKKDDFVIVYIAEYRGMKNHTRLINAVEPIIKKNPKVKLLLLGQGKLMDSIHSQILALNISDNVIMPGYIREDFVALLKSCNLGLSASYGEGLGLGLLECIAAGLPIVASNNRGHGDIVDNNDFYLFNPLNERSITKKISDAINNPGHYHIVFPKKFSLKNSLEEMREIYSDILDL